MMAAHTPGGSGGDRAAPELLIVADAAAWRAWLDLNEDTSDGVWLVLAKKHAAAPTSLTYAEALEEALCSGWIDGRRKRIDDTAFQQHFTPRRKTSIWSQRNVGIVTSLKADGRMRPRGQAEIDRAKADGRWERAYSGQAAGEIPADLLSALEASPTAAGRFSALTGAERHTALLRLVTATSPRSRADRLRKLIDGWETTPDLS